MAERAKLDKDNFWLHKFRATFATRCLWAGVDLRTVQQWLGHSDMECTMRYLKPSRSQQTRERSTRFSPEDAKFTSGPWHRFDSFERQTGNGTSESAFSSV